MKKLMASKAVMRLWSVFVVLSLLLSLAASTVGAAAPQKPDPIHPKLAKMADQNPGGKVRVIVQGDNPKGKLASTLDRHGAQNKKALPLVKGYAAELSLGQVKQLAKEPGINWITFDAEMKYAAVSIANLGTLYPLAVQADKVWNGATGYTGAGVGVAVLDSGINTSHPDLAGKVVKEIELSSLTNNGKDQYGHGTHVAGIIAGSGAASNGKYLGVAPGANLINVKLCNSVGLTYMSDVIAGIKWVLENRDAYNIRVINLSLVSSIAESYRTSPLAGAVEMAWLSGVVVVASSGNDGTNTALYAPGNDPFIITVGATDLNGTAAISDDLIPEWSGYGVTQDGYSKPEIVAPGRQIVSLYAGPSTTLGKKLPDRVTDTNYFRLSGTSMSTPVVSAIAALAFQAHPSWTPDQFKAALMSTARPLNRAGSGAGQVDALAVVNLASPGHANSGLALNNDVATAVDSTLAGTSATWNSATWNSATWNSATWNSATWNSATWNSATWNSATWNSATWNSATWNSASADYAAIEDLD